MVHLRALLVAASCATLLAGCGSSGPPAAAPAPDPPTSTSVVPTPTAAPAPRGTVPPAWLGTRVLPRTASGYGEIRPTPPLLRERRFTLPGTVPALGGSGFRAIVSAVPLDVLARSTWKPACPVTASDLRWVRLTFRGFDGARHTGELLVNQAVAHDLVGVFRELWRDDYPIEELRITRSDENTAPPTGDGNDTGAFSCRSVVGETVFSEHASGLAIDVNPFQNPYVKGDLVLPELASSYLDRGRRRPGMIEPGDVVVRAFARIGWEWGGSWRSLKDLQHFSRNGR